MYKRSYDFSDDFYILDFHECFQKKIYILEKLLKAKIRLIWLCYVIISSKDKYLMLEPAKEKNYYVDPVIVRRLGEYLYKPPV